MRALYTAATGMAAQELSVQVISNNIANLRTTGYKKQRAAFQDLIYDHDSCGAIDATIKSLKDNSTLPGHLPTLVSALAPAVKASEGKSGDRLANAIRQNVIDNVAKLKSAAPILSAAVEQNKLKVVGGIYRLATGKVELVG